MERRSTRSNSIPHDGTDAQFWAAQPNPRQIERGHAEAVALTRVAMRTMTEGTVEDDVRNWELNTVLSETQQRIPATEEGASFSTGDISSEVNTTKQDGSEPPTYAQQYRETPAHYTTGTPTETGTPEQPLANSLDGYLGDGLEDVLQNSQLLQGSLTALLAVDNQTQEEKPMPLAWVVPDTTNRTLEEIEERTIVNFRSPGGGTGALVVLLPRLSQFYHTDRFTVDIDSGEVFAHTRNRVAPGGTEMPAPSFQLKHPRGNNNTDGAGLQRRNFVNGTDKVSKPTKFTRQLGKTTRTTTIGRCRNVH